MSDPHDFEAQQDLNILEEARKIEGDSRRTANVKGLASRIHKRVSEVNSLDEVDKNIEKMKRDGFTTSTPKDVGM